MKPMIRTQIEQQICRYFDTLADYRTLGGEEFEVMTQMERDLPQDTVASPILDQMPHGIGIPGDPTGRIVVNRESLRERYTELADDLLAEKREALDYYLKELGQMWNFYSRLNWIDRWIVSKYYWNGLTQEGVANYFVKYEDHFDGFEIPRTQPVVSERLRLILVKAERAGMPIPAYR